MGGIGIWQLLIVLVIVFMLFGTKRLKGLGADVGEAIQGFRKSMGNGPATDEAVSPVKPQAPLQADSVQQAEHQR
ncbi:twin-arginine translocase TatA/TatE family subunit [Pseudomonas sp. NPDC087612]|uniref:twin-arginine translocase TatA/TatE family subunit n=1 Tax=unclassified Pseudomonas TaxID=196821 RepID=UPI001BCFCA79|nr:twin-arginine translocase TatA/TatE family subunit [Pseudomonas sp. SORT22]QVM95747.1 twin-arginine translocase TatA/TatE family subunit [Pseudomonas sp. SORT22]